jgi:hypothetical protein
MGVDRAAGRLRRGQAADRSGEVSVVSLFTAARWIWIGAPTAANAYVLFARSLPRGAALRARIAASTHYELFVDGRFVARGPVPAERGRALVDEAEVALERGAAEVEVAIVVHHERGRRILAVADAPPGLRAEFDVGGRTIGTDASWSCRELDMWRSEEKPRGWALGYCEEYRASSEPAGWSERRFPAPLRERWSPAVEIADADAIWSTHERRPVPMLARLTVLPRRVHAWHAGNGAPVDVADLSEWHDTEPLEAIRGWVDYSQAAIAQAGANAFTCDLGAEHIGHYAIEVEVPPGGIGTSIEISGAELLRDGRPWIFRKGCRYTVRYHARGGRRAFTSFSWSGFRYLHVVIRGGGARLLGVSCAERRVPLPAAEPSFTGGDERLQRIFALCRRTLEVGVQEHLIDCPTREQAQYWGDAAFIARSLGIGWGEWSWLRWFLDCFIRAPFRPDGQIGCVFPGEHVSLVDYSLIPVIAQRFWREATGTFHRPRETLVRALELKRWYDQRLVDGLVTLDHADGMKQGAFAFIDHPGLGWHDFPHRGLDRDGASCALNTFLFGFLRTLAEVAAEAGETAVSAALTREADALRTRIRAAFLVDGVLYDALKDGRLSDGTSWQSNGLAVYLGLLAGDEATRAMRAMLDGYDRLCRCSPYFHFIFLPALRSAGLEREARELIVREWGPMLDAGATTTWEGFAGDAKDTLCHPWSAAPFAFLLEGPQR